MKQQYGTHPHVFDARDHSLFRTFPWLKEVPIGGIELDEYTYDAGLSVPNQMAQDNRFNPPLPSLPFGCTGETSTDICGDEDKATYDPKYTYDKTCEMEGHGADQGCQIRNSMGSLTIYGLRKDGETQAQAEVRKRGQYFFIEKISGRDWFDSFRTALRNNKRSISMGIPWFIEWRFPQRDGILTPNFIYDGKPEHYAWHNVKVCGEKILADGTPALRVKPWLGIDYGDNGFVYMDRATFNKVFDNWGTIAATPGPVVRPQDVVYVKIQLLQYALQLLNKLLAALQLQQKKIYA